MFLNQLEIFGFKSFPAKLDLRFGDGITGIVGPNGCGKTNIVDAIRWVLGEQKPTLLRSEQMEDVIFNGTTQRKPLGMAEVSLTVDNTRGVLAPEYSEVMVTRRLFRSGESEYLINKTPCRRKDIIEMFLDTGMASHAYSVIELSMVESILGGQAEALRVLFEEAAGISKYKARRREALRKLARTKDNLLRVGDIFEEVEKQVHSLHRQASKAERFQRYAQELREIELTVAGKHYRQRKEELDRIRKLLAAVQERAQLAQDGLTEKETRAESLRQQVTEQQGAVTTVRTQLMETGEKIHRLEEQVLVSEERSEGLGQQGVRIQTEIENLDSKLESHRTQRQERILEAEKAAQELSTAQQSFSGLEETLNAVDGELLQKRTAVERARRQVSDLSQERNDLRGEANRLGAHQDTTQVRKQSLRGEMGRLDDQQARVSEDLRMAQENLNKARKNAEQLQKELRQGQEKADQLATGYQSLLQEERELLSQIEIRRSKSEMLKGILESYEGYQQGVKALLTGLKDLPGVLGVVADVLQTEEPYTAAVEAALGEAAQYIIVQTAEVAHQAMKHLRNHKAGRASFLILDQIATIEMATKPEGALSAAQTLAWAPEVVSCDAPFQPVLNYLLGSVLIVEALPRVEPEREGNIQNAISWVTPAGDIMQMPALLRGGQSSEKSGLLDRRRNISREEEALASALASLEKKRARRQEQEAADQKQREAIVELQKSHGSLRAEIIQLENQVEASHLQLKAFQERKTVLETELKDLKPGDGTQHKRLDQLMEKISSLESGLAQKQRSLEKAEQELRSLEEKSRVTAREVNEARVNLVALQGRCDQLRLDADRLEQIEKDLLESTQVRQTEIGEIGQQKKALKAKIAQMGQELQARSAERTELQTREKRLEKEQAALRQGQLEIEAQIKDDRQSRETVQTQTHEYELQVAEIEAKQQAAAERIQQEYQLNLDELPEPQQAQQQDMSLEERQERIQFLRERIRIMGPVNVAALEEYNVQKERMDFISTQRDDLLQAEENLNEVIGNLNRRARRLFTQTFKKVNQNFKTIFTQLFDGGEADLILNGKGDPLEADIEIFACPGGKKLRHIAQLSGGEKALTAISLLFSLYQVKPSPFCVLDEVDAPLDDANIDRFVELLRNLSKQSQFIIITHNKNTMAAADVLYGVTMEQLGVSKVVSVNLRQDEDTAAA